MHIEEKNNIKILREQFLKQAIEWKLVAQNPNDEPASILLGEIKQEKEKLISGIKNQDLTIILTGGDTEFLAKRLKSTIFANSNFLLESLNILSIYLNEND